MKEFIAIIEALDKHASLCVALATVFSVVISSGISFIAACLLRASDVKRMKTERALQLGVDSFKLAYDHAKSGHATKVLPPEVWILSSLKLMEILDAGTKNKKAVTKKIKECIQFSEFVETVYEEENNKTRKPSDLK